MYGYLYAHMYTTYMQCLWRPEESVEFPETRVEYFCELSCGFWDLNPGTRPDELVTELSLQYPHSGMY